MLHRKKVLALALASVAGVPTLADAQDASVVLYGKFYPEWIVGRARHSTPAGTAVSTLVVAPPAVTGDTGTINSLQASNSRFGIRGEERLGPDLKAFFQLEQATLIDAGGSSLASRDSFVGLGSEHWGTVKLGNFDTVYKNMGDTLSFLGVSSGNFVSNSNILSKIPLGTNSSGSFHLRRANSVQYESPDLRGFGAAVQYSPDEAKTTSRNADLISLGVKYENGPAYAAIAWERHRDTFGGSRNARAALSNFADLNARSDDQAVRGTLRYAIGTTTIEGDISRLDFKERGGANGRFERYRHNTYLVSAEHRLGNWRFAASYTWGDNGKCSLIGGGDCSTDGLKGSQASVGASYAFSRRTQIFVMFARLNNGKSARYNNADWSGAVSPGTDIDQLAAGIAHTF